MPYKYEPDPGQGIIFSAISAAVWFLWAMIDFFTHRSPLDIFIKVDFAIGSLAYLIYGVKKNKADEAAVREKLQEEQKDSSPVFQDEEKKE